jgi:hypothetical protein
MVKLKINKTLTKEKITKNTNYNWKVWIWNNYNYNNENYSVFIGVKKRNEWRKKKKESLGMLEIY